MNGRVLGAWSCGPSTTCTNICVDDKVHLTLVRRGKGPYQLSTQPLEVCNGSCKSYCELPTEAEEAVRQFLGHTSQSPDWGRKYQQAVEYFAALCNKSPEEFERERRIRTIFIQQTTSECLTLEEITAGIEDSRQVHIDGCEFCKGLIEAMNRQANPELEIQFADEALKIARK